MDKLRYWFEEVCIFDFVLNCPFKLIVNSFCKSWFMFHARQNWKSQLSTFPRKSRYCGELWVHPTQMTCWLSPQNKHHLWLHDRSLANSEPVPLNRPVYFNTNLNPVTCMLLRWVTGGFQTLHGVCFQPWSMNQPPSVAIPAVYAGFERPVMWCMSKQFPYKRKNPEFPPKHKLLAVTRPTTTRSGNDVLGALQTMSSILSAFAALWT